MVTQPPMIRLSAGFAVPFGETWLTGHERLNRELEALFLSRETDEHRNPTPSHTPQAQTFESRFNLFKWPEACIRELRLFMLSSIAHTITQAANISAEELGKLTMHNHTWFHISRYAGSFVAHNHPLASWSAVYCVRSGERVPEHPGSGVLRFFDSRTGADSFADQSVRRLRAAYALRPREIRLEAGQLVVFPSYVFHEVTPFYGRDTRITVATNCWFAG